MYYYQVFFQYFVTQKILRINGKVPWPVHYTSKVIDAHKITKGDCTEPGDNLGQYINAAGGLILGNNVLIGPNVIIATTNHKSDNFLEHSAKKGITIGDNVWIGGNATILAGAKIGSNVIIGAGCVISEEIPHNSIVKLKANHYEIIPKKTFFS
jgi:acetyltransferase-like isoleucine patch superfamily enzyme